jgi:hypothetical protein
MLVLCIIRTGASFVIFMSIGIAMAQTMAIVQYPLTGEAYTTNVRGTALAINAVFGRIIGAVAPITIYTLYSINPLIPLIAILVFSFVNIINCALLPQDKTGKKLDDVDDEIRNTLLSEVSGSSGKPHD